LIYDTISEEIFALTWFFGIVRNAAEAVLLGFQHYLVMLGTTVIIPTALVPQMGGNNVRFQISLVMLRWLLGSKLSSNS
jgi:xanthine/uracil permease